MKRPKDQAGPAGAIRIAKSGPEARQLRKEAGRWLKGLRAAAGLSQIDLAARLGLKYYTFVSQVENGFGRVPTEALEAWARALGVDLPLIEILLCQHCRKVKWGHHDAPSLRFGPLASRTSRRCRTELLHRLRKSNSPPTHPSLDTRHLSLAECALGEPVIDCKDHHVLELFDQIQAACAAIRGVWHRTPHAGIILGTGLGGLVDEIQVEATLDYEAIPHFLKSTVEGHRGRLVCGELAGVPILAMEGRFHMYEGYSLQQLTLPVRVFKALGAELLIVSNAVGGMNSQYRLGDIMVIDDHINTSGSANHTTSGNRYNDERLDVITDARLTAKAREKFLAMWNDHERFVVWTE